MLPDSCYLCTQLLWKDLILCRQCHANFQRQALICRDTDALPVFSLFHYDEFSEPIIRRGKSGAFPKLASILTEFLALKWLSENCVPLAGLIPAPAREQGGRDHAFVIAEKLASIFRIPIFDDFLQRVSQDQEPQKQKDVQSRSAVKFLHRRPFDRDKRRGLWLLVDDVITTGSTLSQMHKALGRPPAVGLTLASTPRLKSFDFSVKTFP